MIVLCICAIQKSGENELCLSLSSKVQDQIGRFFFLLAKLAISLQEKQGGREYNTCHSSEIRGLCLIENNLTKFFKIS